MANELLGQGDVAHCGCGVAYPVAKLNTRACQQVVFASTLIALRKPHRLTIAFPIGRNLYIE